MKALLVLGVVTISQGQGLIPDTELYELYTFGTTTGCNPGLELQFQLGLPGVQHVPGYPGGHGDLGRCPHHQHHSVSS